MKKTIYVIAFAALISACGPSKEEQVKKITDQCNLMLNDPVMEKQYLKGYIDGWKENVESANGDLITLAKCKEMIIDKWSEAKAEEAVNEEMNKQ